MNYNLLNLYKHLSSILDPSPVANTPLEVSLWVSLDKGVYWSNPSLGSMVGRSGVWWTQEKTFQTGCKFERA